MRSLSSKQAETMKAWSICTLCALLLFPVAVQAAGFGRPVLNGVRAVGMGGAFVAVADDSSAVYHNPAGLMTLRDAEIMLSVESLFMLRSYKPRDPDGVYGAKERASAAPFVLPSLFGGARIKAGRKDYFAFGFGGYPSYGRAVNYKTRPISEGTVMSRLGLYEFAPVLAYQMDPRIYIGASFRIGMGFFTSLQGCGDLLSCNQRREAVEFTRVEPMLGVGFGYSLGIRVEPIDGFFLGASYQSGIKVNMKGNDVVETGGENFDASIEVPFPQSFSIGLAYRITKDLLISAQYKWVDFSRVQNLLIDIEGMPLSEDYLNTPYEWKSSHSVHVGVEGRALKSLVLRGGLAMETPAIPERNRVREFQDGYKMAFDIGASLHFGRWRLDGAIDFLFGDLANGFKVVDYPDDYRAPGKHYAGGSITAHIGGAVTF